MYNQKIEFKTWAELIEALQTDKRFQRSVIVYSHITPLKIYYDGILQKYIVELQ